MNPSAARVLVLAMVLAATACSDPPSNSTPRGHDDSTGMRGIGLAVLEALRTGNDGPVLEQAVTLADRDAVVVWKAAEGSWGEEKLRRASAAFDQSVAHARQEIRETLPRCRAAGQALGIDWAEAELVHCLDGGGDNIVIAFRHQETYHVVTARAIQLPRGCVLTGRIRPPRGLDTLGPKRRERILQRAKCR